MNKIKNKKSDNSTKKKKNPYQIKTTNKITQTI